MTTENQSTDVSNSKPSAAVDKNSPASSTASSSIPGSPPENKKTKSRSSGKIWLLLIILLLLSVIGAMGYYGWQWFHQQSQLLQVDNSQQLEQGAQLQELQQQLQQLRAQASRNQQQQQQQQQQWVSALHDMEARVGQQSQRLKGLSTTTKDDWLLAEAEYLLRLANQRLLMERGGTGALALLTSADAILLQVGDEGLFDIRKQLAADIAALKLAPQVDRSGIYLKLAALADQVLLLPTTPRLLEKENSSSASTALTPEGKLNLWEKVQGNFFTAMGKLGEQVRIRYHDQPLQVLLPPDGERYLRQNIRFNLEQAQLALLREETAIYSNALQQAESLLRQFFPTQPEAQIIADEVAQLSGETIAVQLPDIGGSLKQLKQYSARAHLLDEAAGAPLIEDLSVEVLPDGEAL